MYLFSHADFEGAEFYAARRYVHLTKYVIQEDFFVNGEKEEEEKYELISVSLTPLLIEQRVSGV